MFDPRCRINNNADSSIEHPALAATGSYGTRKIFPVYGSFTSVPGANPSTSMYLPGENGLSTKCGFPGTGVPYGKSPFTTFAGAAGGVDAAVSSRGGAGVVSGGGAFGLNGC